MDSFIIAKGYKQKQPKEETHRVKSGRVPNAKLPPFTGCDLLPVLNGDNTQSIANQGSSLSLWCPGFY